MEAVWVCIMVSRTLPHDGSKDISREMELIFGADLHGFKVACNENMLASGEYYIFVNCSNFADHLDGLSRCHYVTGVVPDRLSPHHFSPKEVSEFLASVGHKEKPEDVLSPNDVVLVKDGYLKGLYGIVIQPVTSRKYKVFFSFYVRQFYETLHVTKLEFIGKVSGYEFPSEVAGKPLVIGAHVVHNRKLCRAEGRKSKAGDRRRRGGSPLSER